MIQHTLNRKDGILVLRPEGAIEAEDFAAIAAAVDPYLEEEGPLRGLMVEATRFPGWRDFDGFVSHLRFVRDHHRQIERVAFVSDSAVLRKLPVVARHFVTAEVRPFPSGQAEEALTWLRGKET